jgi:hypothetical protein
MKMKTVTILDNLDKDKAAMEGMEATAAMAITEEETGMIEAEYQAMVMVDMVDTDLEAK